MDIGLYVVRHFWCCQSIPWRKRVGLYFWRSLISGALFSITALDIRIKINAVKGYPDPDEQGISSRSIDTYNKAGNTRGGKNQKEKVVMFQKNVLLLLMMITVTGLQQAMH